MKNYALPLYRFAAQLTFTCLVCLACLPLQAQNIATGYGSSTSVMLCTDGQVSACGDNNYGQLGDSTKNASTVVVKSNQLSNVVAVAAGQVHTLYLKSDSTVWGCGRGNALGSGSFTAVLKPDHIGNITGVRAIAAGPANSYFMKYDGTLWACGDGILGTGTTLSMTNPFNLSNLSNVVDVSINASFALFLKADGTVWPCGENGLCQLGDSTSIDRPTPFQSPYLTDIIAVKAGLQHSLFLKSDGTVWTCGNNSYWQQGISASPSNFTPTPVKIPSLSGIVAIAAGTRYSLFLKNDGTVWACGQNSAGELGMGDSLPRFFPTKIPNLSGITEIAAAGGHSLFLKNNGTVYACGYNGTGVLGNGTTVNSWVPTPMNICTVGNKANTIIGQAYNDLNQNCVRDAGEPGLADRLVIITPGNLIAQTDAGGYWGVETLPPGSYTVTVDTAGSWLPTCPVTYNFAVTNTDSVMNMPDFGFVSSQPCAVPSVSIHMPIIRRGFSNQLIYVQACNEAIATTSLYDPYVDVVLDPFIILQSASAPYTMQAANTYRFNLDTLYPNECANFTLVCSVSLNAVLNTTLCLEANLYPVSNCAIDTAGKKQLPGSLPCPSPWDNSTLTANSSCVNDSVYFMITNSGPAGTGNMQCHSAVRFFVNGVKQLTDSVKLNGGQTKTFAFEGDGKTWRMEVDQHPEYPGNSQPNTTIEACGNTQNWVPNLFVILPEDDEDATVDIHCGLVTGAYDPNDKTGYPTGVTAAHYIYPNQSLDYVVRFQNTGNDTAFTVIIRDTLDNNLNILSVQSGVASHNYTFRMYGPRVMEWTFSNILLPDSNTDEPGSHGFITYTVKQHQNLPNGTLIQNRAGIYFDFNDPIITNTATHTINDRTGETGVGINEVMQHGSVTVYPNPARNAFTVELNNIVANDQWKFEMYDVMGRQVLQTPLSGQYTKIERGANPTGVYFYRITQNGQSTGNGKLILQD